MGKNVLPVAINISYKITNVLLVQRDALIAPKLYATNAFPQITTYIKIVAKFALNTAVTVVIRWDVKAVYIQ